MLKRMNIDNPQKNKRNHLTLCCSAGMTIIAKKCYLKGYGAVQFYKNGMPNIISLKNIKNKYCMNYDSVTIDCFELIKSKGIKHVFMPSKKRLFNSSCIDDVITALVTTVKE